MLIKTRGIIFRTIKYGESSLIVDLYTEQLGLQKYIVNSVRSRKPKVGASLMQVMSMLDLVVYHRPDRELHRIREVRPAYIYQALPFDLRRGAVGLFMAEVGRKTIRESEANEALFGFLFETFRHLDQTPHSVANLHLVFLLELSGFLGFLPAGAFDAATPVFDLLEGQFTGIAPNHVHFVEAPLSRKISELLSNDREYGHQVALTTGERRALLRHLLDFYRLHIESLPEINAHQILQDVLE